jgi:hypothetical protein
MIVVKQHAAFPPLSFTSSLTPLSLSFTPTCSQVHHVYKQPTAFAALALHPLEFLLIFGGVYAAVFTLTPSHPHTLTLTPGP